MAGAPRKLTYTGNDGTEVDPAEYHHTDSTGKLAILANLPTGQHAAFKKAANRYGNELKAGHPVAVARAAKYSAAPSPVGGSQPVTSSTSAQAGTTQPATPPAPAAPNAPTSPAQLGGSLVSPARQKNLDQVSGGIPRSVTHPMSIIYEPDQYAASNKPTAHFRHPSEALEHAETFSTTSAMIWRDSGDEQHGTVHELTRTAQEAGRNGHFQVTRSYPASKSEFTSLFVQPVSHEAAEETQSKLGEKIASAKEKAATHAPTKESLPLGLEALGTGHGPNQEGREAVFQGLTKERPVIAGVQQMSTRDQLHSWVSDSVEPYMEAKRALEGVTEVKETRPQQPVLYPGTTKPVLHPKTGEPLMAESEETKVRVEEKPGYYQQKMTSEATVAPPERDKDVTYYQELYRGPITGRDILPEDHASRASQALITSMQTAAGHHNYHPTEEHERLQAQLATLERHYNGMTGEQALPDVPPDLPDSVLSKMSDDSIKAHARQTVEAHPLYKRLLDDATDSRNAGSLPHELAARGSNLNEPNVAGMSADDLMAQTTQDVRDRSEYWRQTPEGAARTTLDVTNPRKRRDTGWRTEDLVKNPERSGTFWLQKYDPGGIANLSLEDIAALKEQAESTYRGAQTGREDEAEFAGLSEEGGFHTGIGVSGEEGAEREPGEEATEEPTAEKPDLVVPEQPRAQKLKAYDKYMSTVRIPRLTAMSEDQRTWHDAMREHRANILKMYSESSPLIPKSLGVASSAPGVPLVPLEPKPEKTPEELAEAEQQRARYAAEAKAKAAEAEAARPGKVRAQAAALQAQVSKGPFFDEDVVKAAHQLSQIRKQNIDVFDPIRHEFMKENALLGEPVTSPTGEQTGEARALRVQGLIDTWRKGLEAENGTPEAEAGLTAFRKMQLYGEHFPKEFGGFNIPAAEAARKSLKDRQQSAAMSLTPDLSPEAPRTDVITAARMGRQFMGPALDASGNLIRETVGRGANAREEVVPSRWVQSGMALEQLPTGGLPAGRVKGVSDEIDPEEARQNAVVEATQKRDRHVELAMNPDLAASEHRRIFGEDIDPAEAATNHAYMSVLLDPEAEGAAAHEAATAHNKTLPAKRYVPRGVPPLGRYFSSPSPAPGTTTPKPVESRTFATELSSRLQALIAPQLSQIASDWAAKNQKQIDEARDKRQYAEALYQQNRARQGLPPLELGGKVAGLMKAGGGGEYRVAETIGPEAEARLREAFGIKEPERVERSRQFQPVADALPETKVATPEELLDLRMARNKGPFSRTGLPRGGVEVTRRSGTPEEAEKAAILAAAKAAANQADALTQTARQAEEDENRARGLITVPSLGGPLKTDQPSDIIAGRARRRISGREGPLLSPEMAREKGLAMQRRAMHGMNPYEVTPEEWNPVSEEFRQTPHGPALPPHMAALKEAAKHRAVEEGRNPWEIERHEYDPTHPDYSGPAKHAEEYFAYQEKVNRGEIA